MRQTDVFGNAKLDADKLKLNGGDIKAVQGDSGHAQAKMITDQYSHILDESRIKNAHLLQNAFYSDPNDQKKPDSESKDKSKDDDDINPEKIAKLIKNPEVLELLLKLSKAYGDE